jgi:hypothetical protein
MGLSEKDEVAAASHFLDGFMKLFSKDVGGWTRSTTQPIKLSGYIGVKSSWSGDYHGLSNRGNAYFFIVGRNAYYFHAFGRSDVPNELLTASFRAIEALTIEGEEPLK